MTAPRNDEAREQAGNVAQRTTLNPQFKHTRRALQAVLVLHGLWMART